MPNNSHSRAAHALLIASPTVAATRELVSECFCPLLSPRIALQGEVVLAVRVLHKTNPLRRRARSKMTNKLIKQITELTGRDLYGCRKITRACPHLPAPLTQVGIRTCEKFSGDFGANEKCTFICASECVIYEGRQQTGRGGEIMHTVCFSKARDIKKGSSAQKLRFYPFSNPCYRSGASQIDKKSTQSTPMVATDSKIKQTTEEKHKISPYCS